MTLSRSEALAHLRHGRLVDWCEVDELLAVGLICPTCRRETLAASDQHGLVRFHLEGDTYRPHRCATASVALREWFTALGGVYQDMGLGRMDDE